MSKIKVLSRLVPSEASLSGLPMSFFLIRTPGLSN